MSLLLSCRLGKLSRADFDQASSSATPLTLSSCSLTHTLDLPVATCAHSQELGCTLKGVLNSSGERNSEHRHNFLKLTFCVFLWLHSKYSVCFNDTTKRRASEIVNDKQLSWESPLERFQAWPAGDREIVAIVQEASNILNIAPDWLSWIF